MGLKNFINKNISSAFNDVKGILGGVTDTVFGAASGIVKGAGGVAGDAMNVAGGVAGQATNIIQDNPAVVAGVGAAFGLPTAGLGGLLGGTGGTQPNDSKSNDVQSLLSKYWYLLLVIPLLMFMKKRR